jgi:protein-L-isoaspartate O-methyltransferase
MADSAHGRSREDRIRSALPAVKRRPFVDGELVRRALDDPPIPGAPGHATPPTETVERILGGLKLPPDGRVLLVGTGSGYGAAVLSRLVRPGLHARAPRRRGAHDAQPPACAPLRQRPRAPR